jgi:hypothetical protein
MKNNTVKYFMLTLILWVGQQIGFSQGSFENLNFESATIVTDPSNPYYPYAINAADALPGWVVVAGGIGGGDIAYNDQPAGAAWATLQGPGSHEPILQGNYSVGLFGSSAGQPANAAIGQTGQIPSSTQTLLFYGADIDNLQVSFAGQLLTYVAVGTGPNYTIYGANISAYAGVTGQLLFNGPANGGGEIDNIQFSPSAIPEPGTWALMLCGVTLLGLSRWKRKKGRPH